jgi:hypothetical protein
MSLTVRLVSETECFLKPQLLETGLNRSSLIRQRSEHPSACWSCESAAPVPLTFELTDQHMGQHKNLREPTCQQHNFVGCLSGLHRWSNPGDHCCSLLSDQVAAFQYCPLSLSLPGAPAKAWRVMVCSTAPLWVVRV